MAKSKWVGLGVLVGAMVACGSDTADSMVDDDASVPGQDAGEHIEDASSDKGDADAGANLDASMTTDSATERDADVLVNDAGKAVACVKSSDCPTDYRCEQHGASKACVKPTGLYASCESNINDCRGFDASECVLGDCAVYDCAATPSICPSGWTCCKNWQADISVCWPDARQCNGLTPVPE